jgi:hypothetical protein
VVNAIPYSFNSFTKKEEAEYVPKEKAALVSGMEGFPNAEELAC